MHEPLPGTARLLPEWRASFRDWYAQQHAQTLGWLDRALATAAVERDRLRRHDAAWRQERRQRLRERTGAGQVPISEFAAATFQLATGEMAYVIRGEAGLAFGGLVWAPEGAPARALVVLAGADGGDVQPQVEAYRRQGCRVVVPALARAARSFGDDRQRRHYGFTDDEVVHLFSFIVGGSLAGLEAAELAAVARAFGADDRGAALPVILDGRGRRTLTAAIAAALDPALADVLVLHPEVRALDHQELAARVDTIWGYHQDFDALTLLALAESAALLFVEDTPTPSAVASRAAAWFASSDPASPRRVGRVALAADDADGLAAAVMERLPARAASPAPSPFLPAAPPAGVATLDDLYRQALLSKLAWLEGRHERAEVHRRARYAPGTMAPEEYYRRVEESLARVMGPPLPETADRRVRTRLVEERQGHRVYEVVFAAVEGIDVPGYLLVPTSGLPAPAVICQHGAGGRADHAAGIADSFGYDRLGARLADKGYVVFAPYATWGWGSHAGLDALTKRAYALGITPNRFDVAQLHAIVDFLRARPEVIADRVGYYGLSYGGHASLWLGSCEPRLAVRVTSGFFNEFQKKLTATSGPAPWAPDRPMSFLAVGYGWEMYTFNTLNELGHAELATSMAPRPHLVEDGLRDGVAPNAWADEEFARVAAVYAWLGAADAAVLEHFDGPHRIWAEGSFPFLHRHLKGDGPETSAPRAFPPPNEA